MLDAMYAVDAQDMVKRMDDVPQSDIGAPMPMVSASENALAVAYFVPSPVPGWDGTSVRVVTAQGVEAAACVRFVAPVAHLFGPPNDEAFAGHPLAARGLRPYGAFEVLHSSWIRSLERMNAIHPHHRPESYAELRHFILSFHDSTFECVARGYQSVLGHGPLESLLRRTG